MFIRPVGATVRAADRPAGHPLLRGLLARAAGAMEATAGAVGPDGPPRRGLLARAVQAAGGPAVAPTWTWPEGEPAEPEPELESELEAESEREPLEPAEQEPVVDEALAQARAGTRPEDVPTSGPTPSAGLVAELTQLADLTREGLLTPEEFTAAKARLLRG
ncbi:SHOCT domain-containing protein [Streptomyces sp. NPDC054849]